MVVNRRDTIASLLSAATAAFLSTPARSQNFSPMGLQLYTVRALLKQDFEGTLARIATLGYRQVEFAGVYASSLHQTATILKRYGLSAPSGHASYAQLERELPVAIQAANELGQEFIVCPYLDERDRRTLDDWKRVGHRFNEIGSQARKAKLSFAYHNHDFEFLEMDGRIPYDVLLGETDPDLVKLEIDLYWMAKAKRDPIAYFQKYPKRFPLLHLKDMADDGTITDVGKGTVDFKSILGRAALAGIAYCFVEHDDPSDPILSIETSLRFVRQLGF